MRTNFADTTGRWVAGTPPEDEKYVERLIG